MSDTSQGPGWWIASDDKWYAPELHADPDYRAKWARPPMPEAPSGIEASNPLLDAIDGPADAVVDAGEGVTVDAPDVLDANAGPDVAVSAGDVDNDLVEDLADLAPPVIPSAGAEASGTPVYVPTTPDHLPPPVMPSEPDASGAPADSVFVGEPPAPVMSTEAVPLTAEPTTMMPPLTPPSTPPVGLPAAPPVGAPTGPLAAPPTGPLYASPDVVDVAPTAPGMLHPDNPPTAWPQYGTPSVATTATPAVPAAGPWGRVTGLVLLTCGVVAAVATFLPWYEVAARTTNELVSGDFDGWHNNYGIPAIIAAVLLGGVGGAKLVGASNRLMKVVAVLAALLLVGVWVVGYVDLGTQRDELAAEPQYLLSAIWSGIGLWLTGLAAIAALVAAVLSRD